MTPVVRIILLAVGGVLAFLSGSTQADIIQTAWGAVPILLSIISGSLVTVSVSGFSERLTAKCGCGRVIFQDSCE